MNTRQLKEFVTPQVERFIEALNQTFPEKSAGVNETLPQIHNYGGKRELIRYCQNLSKE